LSIKHWLVSVQIITEYIENAIFTINK